MVRHSKVNRRDVAVVLGCVLFAFLALGAVGESGRRRAQATVCQANLRLWRGIFQDYMEENGGKFITGTGAYGYWWPVQLSPEYQDWQRNRAWFCPTAATPLIDTRGVLARVSPVFRAWGIYSEPGLMHDGDKTYVTNPNG